MYTLNAQKMDWELPLSGQTQAYDNCKGIGYGTCTQHWYPALKQPSGTITV